MHRLEQVTGCRSQVVGPVGLTRRALLVLLCLVFALLSGCGGGIKRKVESGIAKSLQQRLGPAKTYSVKVAGSTMSIVSGKIDAVEISGEDVRLAKGITVARLDVNLRDLVVDTGTQEIRKCRSATYSAAVSERELNRYLVTCAMETHRVLSAAATCSPA